MVGYFVSMKLCHVKTSISIAATSWRHNYVHSVAYCNNGHIHVIPFTLV
jgi:hypothetical protein